MRISVNEIKMEVQTKAEIVNKTENIERMEGKGVEENELLNRDEQISDTKEETIDTRGTTQTGPTIKTDILNAVAPSIDGKWKALAEKIEKMGLQDTIEYVEESRSSE